MIKKLAKHITTNFINNNIFDESEYDIYEYCFEATIVSGASYIILLVLSIIFNEFICSIIFLFSFSLFRKICGGYHANSYSKCGIMSLGSYLLLIFLIKTIPFIFNISSILLIIGALIIILLSPIEDKNKPFTKRQFKLFKTISNGFASLFIIIFVILDLYGFHNNLINKYYFSCCYGIDLVALALLMSKIERRLHNAKKEYR